MVESDDITLSYEMMVELWTRNREIRDKDKKNVVNISS